MLAAIVVALITLVVAILALVAFFMMRSRREQRVDSTRKEARTSAASIESVGVSSSLNDPKTGMSKAHVRSSDSTSGKVSEPVHSRFVVMGVLATGIFSALTAKLWSMQVLSSSAYQSAAASNKYTTVSTPAPRGLIYDSDGVVLVKNRTALAVLADADVIDDHDVMQRLSAVLGIPYNVVRMRIQDTSSGAQSQRVVAEDARLRDVAFIAEHSDAFSGVTVQKRSVRSYPYGALAAHALGYTGKVSDEELANAAKNRDIELGDIVGKSGVEAYYDNYLAGEHGQRTVIADSEGNVVEVESETPALRGSDVYLTIKAPVQYVADKALANLIAPSGIIGQGKGVGGAVVAMDVRDGSILALASYPTYSPASFTGGISQDIWDLYSSSESYYPLLNRTIAGTYPAASTYKAFTTMAGLKYGFADTTRTWNCTGSWDGFNSGDVQHCWLLTGHGYINLHTAITVSCDTVFYEIAKDFFYAGVSQGGTISDTAMQEEIAKFGFGQTTGIDLSGEDAGRIPTPEWKAAHWADVPTEAQWRGGDMTNLAIGQGDVLVTPIQMAVAYATIATGRVVKPHLLKEVRNTSDTAAVKAETQVVSTPDLDAEDLDFLRDALNGVAAESTALQEAFANYDIPITDVVSKTGTGEVAGKGDVAWYVCYTTPDDPKYLVAVCIEEGGGGAAVAGPVAAEVLNAIYQAEAGTLTEVGVVAGSSGQSVTPTTSTSTARTD